eukprot:6094091-Alexandrium_andersonii.AAC.1
MSSRVEWPRPNYRQPGSGAHAASPKLLGSDGPLESYDWGDFGNLGSPAPVVKDCAADGLEGCGLNFVCVFASSRACQR